MTLLLILYNTIFPLVTRVVKLFSGLSPRLRSFFKIRKNLFLNLEKAAGSIKDQGPRIWIHAASAGEFEQARPIITELKKKRPDAHVFVSFLSSSGYTVYKSYSDAESVFYHPVDTKRNAEKTVKLIRPDIVLIMRYDFWLNHLYTAKKNGAVLILAAAVLQEHSMYFKPFVRQFYHKLFSLFDYIFTVSEKDRERFAETFGRSDAPKAGNPRFDQVMLRSSSTDRIGYLKKFYRGTLLLVAGSTWEKDEDLLLAASRTFDDRLSMILVPHDVSTGNITRLETSLESADIPFAKISSLPDDFSAHHVLVVDQIGFLVELYALAQIAYVGGGFGVNVHNTLEPSVYGIPVLFGPNYHNSPEAEELVNIAAASEIRDEHSLLAALRRLVYNQKERELQGGKAGSYVRNHLGASKAVAEKIISSINSVNS